MKNTLVIAMTTLLSLTALAKDITIIPASVTSSTSSSTGDASYVDAKLTVHTNRVDNPHNSTLLQVITASPNAGTRSVTNLGTILPTGSNTVSAGSAAHPFLTGFFGTLRDLAGTLYAKMTDVSSAAEWRSSNLVSIARLNATNSITEQWRSSNLVSVARLNATNSVTAEWRGSNLVSITRLNATNSVTEQWRGSNLVSIARLAAATGSITLAEILIAGNDANGQGVENAGPITGTIFYASTGAGWSRYGENARAINMTAGTNSNVNMRRATTSQDGVIEHVPVGGHLYMRAWNESGSTNGNVILQDLGGSVGIGTNNPAKLLHLVGSLDVQEIIESNDPTDPWGSSLILDNNATNDVAGGSIVYRTRGNVSKGAIKFFSNGDIRIASGGQGGSLDSVITIYSNGNVNAHQKIGIGTNNPEALLHLVDGRIVVRRVNDTSWQNVLSGSRGNSDKVSLQTFGNGAGKVIASGFVIGNYPSVTWTNTGAVVIGSLMSFIDPLNVKSDSGHDAVLIEENSGTERWGMGVNAAGDLLFKDDGTATMVTFLDGGSVGIGTNSPGNTLHVFRPAGGNVIKADGKNAGGDVSISMRNQGDSNVLATCILSGLQSTRYGGRMTFGRENNSNWVAATAYADGYIALSPVLNNTDTERMRITSTGLVGIGTTQPRTMLDVAGTVSAASGGYYMNGVQITNDICYSDSNPSIGTNYFCTFSRSNSVHRITTQLKSGTCILNLFKKTIAANYSTLTLVRGGIAASSTSSAIVVTNGVDSGYDYIIGITNASSPVALKFALRTVVR